MMARQNKEKGRMVSCSEMVRLNGGCGFVAGGKLYYLSSPYLAPLVYFKEKN